MSAMDAKELRDLTPEELQEKEKSLRKELFNLRFQAVSGHVEKPMRMKEVKRDIARVLTISQMKKREEAAAKKPASAPPRT